MALDLYSMLAMGGPGPSTPVPAGPSRTDAMSQIMSIRDQMIPQEYAQMEQADRSATSAYAAGSAAADLFLASTLGVPERVERGYTDSARVVADTSDQLGKGVRSRDEGMAGDIYQSLAGAGQDTEVASALRDIAGRSQGVINAMGAGTVTNLLTNANAGKLYADQQRSAGAQGFQAAGNQAAAGARAAQRQISSGYETQVADVMRDFGRQSAAAAERAAGQAQQDDWEKRKFIAQTVVDLMRVGAGQNLDWAKFNQDVNEFSSLYGPGGYYPNRDSERAAAAAADDAQRAAEQAAKDREKAATAKAKARQTAVGNRDDALRDIRDQAMRLAKQLLKTTKKVKRPKRNEYGDVIEGQYVDETVPAPPAYAQALRQILGELMTTYQVELSRTGLKRSRVEQIVRSALSAAQYPQTSGL